MCGSEEGRHLELIEGQVVEGSPDNKSSSYLASVIVDKLRRCADEHDPRAAITVNLGLLTRRQPDTVRVPDAAYECGSSVVGPIVNGWAETVADVAVEVTSPSDREGAVRAKGEAWLEAGAKVDRIVWPEERAVEVHTAGAVTRTVDADGSLTGPELLPGFELPVAERFGRLGERHG